MGVDSKKFLKETFVEIYALKKRKVFLVFNLQDHHVYIKKVYKKESLPYRELEKIAHPGLPQIYYVCQLDGKTYTIQEYINGDNLADLLKKYGKFSKEQVLEIALQISDVLIHLHERNIIHRDIKPSNIILDKNGCAKLIDFDVARIMTKEKKADTTFLGTKGYAPPEQYGFTQTDARSDIYSLGITLKELLPHNYNGYLLDIIALCTKFDPNQRIDSAKKLKMLLEQKPCCSKSYVLMLIILLFVAMVGCSFLYKYHMSNVREQQNTSTVNVKLTTDFFYPKFQQNVEKETECNCPKNLCVKKFTD